MERVELKNRAKDQLRGNWGIAIGGVLLAAIFIDFDIVYNIAERLGLERVTLSVSVNLLSIFLGGVISTGLCKLLLNIATKRKKPNVENIFSYIFYRLVDCCSFNIRNTRSLGSSVSESYRG